MPGVVNQSGAVNQSGVVNQPVQQSAAQIEIDWEARNRAAETANLRAAMAASLQENEVRKESEVPLKDRQLNEIIAHFAGSSILKEVRGADISFSLLLVPSLISFISIISHIISPL